MGLFIVREEFKKKRRIRYLQKVNFPLKVTRDWHLKLVMISVIDQMIA